MGKMLNDFKSFALKGNIFDLAVGVVIGSAFGKIVTSFVNDIIMPLLSLVLGKINLSAMGYTLVEQDANGNPVVLQYGLFAQNIIDFLIIAFSVFMVIRLMSKFKKKEEKKEEIAEVKISQEAELLTEIRDLLKDKN